jgi:serine/threonine-protein kinase
MEIVTGVPTADPLVGQRFADRYRVRLLIARGSNGRVYAAEQLGTGRLVALKLLAPIYGNGRSDHNRVNRERFLREAQQLARLSHPNTVRVYDHGVEDGQAYIAMEYVEGQTLAAMLDEGPIDPLRSVRIARQICGSLAEAHELGLIHRDLKPANVLVSRRSGGNDAVKVVDFGLVKEVEDAVHMTGDGQLVGTPMFMSPEQIRGHQLDQRCDIYALGVLLYRALTGAFPFPEGMPAPVLMSHLNDPPLPFSAVTSRHLPSCVEWTVQRCLEKDREARFVDVRELDRALRLCEASLLDESATSLTQLRLVDGRLLLPESLYGATSSEPWRGVAFFAVGAVTVAVLAMVFGFVLVKGVLAAMEPPEIGLDASPARAVEAVEMGQGTPIGAWETQPVPEPLAAEPAALAEPLAAPGGVAEPPLRAARPVRPLEETVPPDLVERSRIPEVPTPKPESVDLLDVR